MKQLKYAILFVLLACFLMGSVSAAAELPPEQVDYYILFEYNDKTVNTKDGKKLFEQAEHQDVLHALMNVLNFQYPDDVQVNFHVHTVRVLDNEDEANTYNVYVNNIQQIFSGTLEQSSDLDLLYQALENTSEHSVKGSEKKTLYRFVQDIDQPNAHFVVVCDMENGKNKNILANCFGNGISHCILNTNEKYVAKADNALNVMLFQPGTEFETAYNLFKHFGGDQYVQDVVLHSTANMDYTVSASNAETQKVLLDSKLMITLNEAEVFENRNLTQIRNKATDRDLSLQFESLYDKTHILVVDAFVPFVLNNVSQLQEEYGMKDTVLLECSVDVFDPQKGYRHIPEQWEVEAVLLQDQNEFIVKEMVYSPEKMCYTASVELTEIVGEYDVLFRATQKEENGLVLENTLGKLSVKNNAPRFLEEKNELKREIWVNTPVEIKNDLFVDLTAFYDDDAGKNHLRYAVKEEQHQGFEVSEDGNLTILPEELNEGISSVTIQVTDKANEVNEEFTVSCERFDGWALLQNGTVSIALQDEEEPIYKDTPLTFNAQYRLPQSAAYYMKRLESEGEEKLAEFEKLISASFDITGTNIPATATRGNEQYTWNFSQTWGQTRNLGEHKASIMVNLGENQLSAQDEITFVVENRAPVIQKANAETEYTVDIPIPFALFPQIDVIEKTLSFDELVKSETLDELTINFSEVQKPEGESLKLYRCQDDLYCYTNEEHTEWEQIEDAVMLWDTAQNAPNVSVRITGYGQWRFDITVKDDTDTGAEGGPLHYTVNVQYYQQQLLTYIAIGIIAFIVLLIIALIVRQSMKPKYGPEDILHVKYGEYCVDLPLHKWKKKGITLQEILIYGGIPYIRALPAKACKHTILMPGKKKYRYAICDAKASQLMVTVDGALQESNKIPIQEHNTVEIHLNEQDMLLLTLKA